MAPLRFQFELRLDTNRFFKTIFLLSIMRVVFYAGMG
jgi:hypothetical protein